MRIPVLDVGISLNHEMRGWWRYLIPRAVGTGCYRWVIWLFKPSITLTSLREDLSDCQQLLDELRDEIDTLTDRVETLK